MLWLKWIKLIFKVVATLLSIVVTIYVVLLVINWQDEAPSTAASTMRTLQEVPAEITPDNNGYEYFRQHAGATEHMVSDTFSQLMRQCDTEDCNTVLAAQPNVAQLIDEHKPLIDFYQQVRSYPHWYEPALADAAQALPSYHGIMHAQQLLFLQAWLAAQQQDIPTVRLLLQQDLQFWRTVLSGNNLLLSKMISIEAVKRHFSFATVLKQQIEPQQQADMMPDSWLAPFTPEELSLLQALSGEWVFGDNAIAAALKEDLARDDIAITEQLSIVLSKPFFLMQATSNDRAAMLLAQANAEVQPIQPWYSWVYNPAGKLINSVTPDYSSYQKRLEGLEPLRQQAIAIN